MTNNNNKLSISRIEYFMKLNNLNQSDIARALDISQPVVSQKLSSQVGWSIKDLIHLSRLFNTSADFLMGLTDEPQINEAVPFQVGA